MREKCGATAHGSRGSEETSALLAKVNAFCAQAGVSGTRDRERERETDSGKSDPFFQCRMWFSLFPYSLLLQFALSSLLEARVPLSLAKIIRVRLCAAHVALVVEKMSLERKVVGSAAMDGTRRHVGRRRKSTFPN